MKTRYRAREITEVVKYLVCKHEHLSWHLQDLYKKKKKAGDGGAYHTGVVQTGGHLGLACHQRNLTNESQ